MATKSKQKRIAAMVFFGLTMTALAYALISLFVSFYWTAVDGDALDISFPVVYGIASVVFLVFYLSFKRKNKLF